MAQQPQWKRECKQQKAPGRPKHVRRKRQQHKIWRKKLKGQRI